MLPIRAFFASLALAITGAQALAVNLVANGGFETGDFSGWNTQAAAAGSLFNVNTGAHSGTYGASFGATNGQADQIWQNLATALNSSYTVSFWVYNRGAGGDSLVVTWNGSEVYNGTPVPTPEAWTQVNILVSSPGTSSEFRFAAYDGPSFVYLDDISVESGNLIMNPGFETGDFSGWNTIGAASGTNFGVTSFGHTGAYSAYFGAISGRPDQIAQTVPTVPGHAYILQFWVNNYNQGADSIRVFWEGIQIHNSTPPPATVNSWVLFNFIVVSTGATSELRLAALDAPAYLFIDDVYLAAPTNGYCILTGDADRNNFVGFPDVISVLGNWGALCVP